MRVFLVGILWQGGTCLQRYEALIDLGVIGFPFDIEYYFPSQYKGLHTIIRKLGWGPRVWKMNRDLVLKAKEFKPDLIWFDKALLVSPNTLRHLKRLEKTPLLIHYSPDDIMNPDNQSRYYLESIPLYDLHITTKTLNINELKELGAGEVYFMDNCYYPNLHRPVQVSAVDRKTYGEKIGFIGTYEADRAKSMLEIAKAGYQVRIWGGGWDNRDYIRHPNLRVENRVLRGEEYVRAICSIDINLCFLRKANRDKQTTRSAEIPACGGFMLAERTDEHLRLFKEGWEAEFFESDQESLGKIKYYLEHDDKRRLIAQKGHERCINSGYSNQERIKEMLRKIGNLRDV